MPADTSNRLVSTLTPPSSIHWISCILRLRSLGEV